MPGFIVRAIERADREQWAPLWRAYLDFYRAVESPEVTDATWSRIFDPLEPAHAVVAARDGDLIGFSHYLFQRSTWLVNSRCYLQDLYVSPGEPRGKGRVRSECAERKIYSAAFGSAERQRPMAISSSPLSWSRGSGSSEKGVRVLPRPCSALGVLRKQQQLDTIPRLLIDGRDREGVRGYGPYG